MADERMSTSTSNSHTYGITLQRLVEMDHIKETLTGSFFTMCQQKTYTAYVAFKNLEKTKPCPIKYCKKCLLNRYGEKAEDVELLDQWDCPKCKGICNCSTCMKKRGQQPTGQLAKMGKAGGFSSVLDLIDAKGVQNVSNYKRAKGTTASPRKLDVVAES
uniref:cell division cycle-associated protein 7-like n=1 Tax=Erigeron canadensis TaxID=72917 RepID=UPI001CB93C0F|nr:cell division cycle-associated protein 7-like [Erigeron canadensis]